MNAAGQRRLTPILAVATAALAAVCAAMVFGVGRSVTWDDAVPPEPLPAARAVEMPPPSPLARFAEVWQRPLFMADRKPVAAADTDDSSSNIGDLELTGIIMTPGLRMALLRDRGKDTTVRVKEGTALADGHWTLASLSPRSAVFDNGGEHRELTLKVAAPEALTKNAQRPGMPPGQVPGQPPQPPRPQPTPSGNGVHVEQQPAPGMTGPSLPHPASPATRDTPPRQDDDALQRARIEALKQAVQKRRMEQQQQRQQAVDSQ
jgi:general secretion pathway protein N